MKVIFDTSVAAKWYFNEENSNEAKKLLEDNLRVQNEVIEPYIFLFEMGNIFLNKKTVDQEAINSAIDRLNRIGINFIDISFFEIDKIIQFAYSSHLSFYDASYVFLAQKLDCEFYTADKKLFNKVKSRKIKIRLL